MSSVSQAAANAVWIMLLSYQHLYIQHTADTGVQMALQGLTQRAGESQIP